MQINKIYYGVIGVGHIGNYHAQQIQKIPGVILEGVYDVLLEQAQKVSKKNKTKVYHELSDLLSKCQAVTIATPAHSHFQLAMQALHHNCHIFIEKPITTRIKEANQIIALAKKKNRLIQVGHIERFNPVVEETKKLLDQKLIGDIYQINVNRMGPNPNRKLDTGVFLDLATHDIDIVRYLLGEEPISVYSCSNTINGKIQYEDLGSSILTFSNNKIVNINGVLNKIG